MNIAIIGHGKMGHAIEALATQRGHKIVSIFDNDDDWMQLSDKWAILPDVAIEFTTPATAAKNVELCLLARVPVVCGTTGWYNRYDELASICREQRGRLFTATNFSIGMNIMFQLNRRLARLMAGRNDYRCSIAETHHIHKLDAPSGTAITLQQQIVADGERKAEDVPIASFREGEVPGTHTVVYDSAIDTLTLTHEAHSRQGLALGALLAAEFLADARPGVYTMDDILQ